MDNNKKVAKKKMNKKPLLSESTKQRIVAICIVLLLVVSLGGYFIYFTGVPAKILTGVSYYETDANGKVNKMYTAKVTELNYYFSAVYNQYRKYGILNDSVDPDTVFNQADGTTYRDLLNESAAESLKQVLLYNREAEEAGFKSESAKAATEATIETLRDTAKSYNMTADDYLNALYGRGMTVRTFRDIVYRELMAEEYKEYLLQSTFMPTQDEVTMLRDVNPTEFGTVTYHTYFFAAEHVEDSDPAKIEESHKAAVAKAQAVIESSTDPASFREACKGLVTGDALGKFAADQDPTINSDMTAQVVKAQNEMLRDYLFASDRKTGDMTVIEDEMGAYAVYFVSRNFDETPTVSYRVLYLENDKVTSGDSVKIAERNAELVQSINEIKSGITDEASFVSAVKTKSDEKSRLNSGALVRGITEASFAEIENIAESEVVFSQWLFDTSRAYGDMTIVERDEGVSLVYFVDSCPAWIDSERTSVAQERLNEWVLSLDPQNSISFTIHHKNVDFSTY